MTEKVKKKVSRLTVARQRAREAMRVEAAHQKRMEAALGSAFSAVAAHEDAMIKLGEAVVELREISESNASIADWLGVERRGWSLRRGHCVGPRKNRTMTTPSQMGKLKRLPMTALPVMNMTSFVAQGGFALAAYLSTRREIYLATLSLVVAGACLFAAVDDSGRGVNREKWRTAGLFTGDLGQFGGYWR
ncbi:hypothetical protein [Corynebacterium sp. CCM 9204]|uniref:hypothetical protein n=1 Tax=Corynebacterium sp. CCM 9204 TaxID=3057616 RepID=UPI003523E4EB